MWREIITSHSNELAFLSISRNISSLSRSYYLEVLHFKCESSRWDQFLVTMNKNERGVGGLVYVGQEDITGLIACRGK